VHEVAEPVIESTDTNNVVDQISEPVAETSA
jgi:hypothetical protein